MIETFNSMGVFELLLCALIILSLLLEAISFWRTNKQSESILKGYLYIKVPKATSDLKVA